MALLSRYYPANYTEEQYLIEKRVVKHALFTSLSVLVILWLIKVFEVEFKFEFTQWGIFPLTAKGLRGIIFAPLLHANFDHLFFNTIPLLILSNMLLMHGLPYFINATIMITLISGLLIWCIAKQGLYVGASAVVTGYWGLLVTNIYNEGTITSIILGIVCIYYLSGIFYGLFPSQKTTSWQGHLLGLLAGLLTSYLL